MKSLFMIQVGGSYGGTHIENHALQFHMAKDLEDTFEVIRDHWQGQGLHLDAYMKLVHVDGFDIHIHDYASENKNKLYMVCMGGQGDSFLEQHDIMLLVGEEPSSIKERAKRAFKKDWQDVHVDEVICIMDHVLGQGHIHLQASEEGLSNETWHGYRPI